MAKRKCPRKLKDCIPSKVFNYADGGLTCHGIAPKGTGKVRGDILRHCNVNTDGTIDLILGYTPDEMVADAAGATQVLHDYMMSNKKYIKWREKSVKEKK